MSTTVKITFNEADLESIDIDAAAQQLFRTELIRRRALTRTAARTLTTEDYHKLVAATLRHNHGSIDRRQLESIVAFVVSQLYA